MRRRGDILEAWIVLTVRAVVAVGGTIAGLVAAYTADEVFTQQRAERRPVHAVLLGNAAKRTWTVRGSSPGQRAPATDGWSRHLRTRRRPASRQASSVPSPDSRAQEPSTPPEASHAGGWTSGASTHGARERDLVGPQWSHRAG
ncbi:hypothetical protein [Streptomyces griseorubiginosus]|uniref:hypothetical protein n=1 Tax=Streptomyces griseorubiginosus TaxID=67304 RepID=UPI003665EB55